MDLPAELRAPIYAHTFINLKDPVVSRNDKETLPSLKVPALCYVNQAVLTESMPAILSAGAMAIAMKGPRGTNTLTKFLARVPNSQANRSVRHVRIRQTINFNRWNCIINLLGTFSGLRTLQLGFHAKVLPPLPREDPEPLPPVKFTSLFDLPKLQTLTLMCGRGSTMVRRTRMSKEAIFAPLVQSFRDDAKAKNSKVEIVVRYNELKEYQVRNTLTWVDVAYTG
jgi:hypothetical protein